MPNLEKSDIPRGLRKIDARARKASVLVDLSICGGAAMAIAFDVRRATRDVDAIVHGAPDFLRTAAAEIAVEEGWPDDWLNDGVKGFISGAEEMRMMQEFPAPDGLGLRVHTPSPHYMFAMKCMAMRPEGLNGSRDISDIEALATMAGIENVDQALTLIEAFYSARLIPAKVRFGIEEVMDRIARGQGLE